MPRKIWPLRIFEITTLQLRGKHEQKNQDHDH
jgi:hypothetical protein